MNEKFREENPEMGGGELKAAVPMLRSLTKSLEERIERIKKRMQRLNKQLEELNEMGGAKDELTNRQMVSLREFTEKQQEEAEELEINLQKIRAILDQLE